MTRAFQESKKMLDAAAATGTGIAMEVADFRHLVLHLATTGNANFTLKVQGSISTQKPDFTASQTPSNAWTYIQSIDLNDQSVVNGSTGVVATGTDINRQLEINTNAQRWVNVIITAYSAGAITVFCMPVNDNA